MKEQTLKEDEINLIDNIFRSTRERNTAKKIYYYRMWGLTLREISEKVHLSVTTIHKYVKKIEQKNGVIQTRDTETMINQYLERLDYLIKSAFEDLEKAQSLTEKVRIRKLLLDLLNAQADSVWRTRKQEPITEKSPLAELREKLIPIIESHTSSEADES